MNQVKKPHILMFNNGPATQRKLATVSAQTFSPARGNSFQSASGGRADRCRASHTDANTVTYFRVLKLFGSLSNSSGSISGTPAINFSKPFRFPRRARFSKALSGKTVDTF